MLRLGMGRQVDLQAAVQAVEQLRCELAQNQQTNDSSKSASSGQKLVISSGLIMSLLGAGWTYAQDKAADKAQAALVEQATQERVERLVKRLEATDARLKELMAQNRQQAIDNVALATHLAAKLDAVSPRARRVATPIAVEAAEARAARFRIGGDQ